MTYPAQIQIDSEVARRNLERAIGRALAPLTEKDVRTLVSLSPVERTQWAMHMARHNDAVTRVQIKRAHTRHPAAPGPEETADDRRQARNVRKRERRARA